MDFEQNVRVLDVGGQCSYTVNGTCSQKLANIEQISFAYGLQGLSVCISMMFLLYLPFKVRQMKGSCLKTTPNYRGIGKLLISIAIAGEQVAVLVQVSRPSPSRSRLSMASATASLVAASAICYLSPSEHGRSFCPSSSIILYVSGSLLCDIGIYAVIESQRSSSSIGQLTLVIICSKFVQLVLELQGKESLLREPYRQLAPEQTASILGRAAVSWVNPLLVHGNKQVLLHRDLPSIDSALVSKRLSPAIYVAWDRRIRPENKMTLILAVARSLSWAFWSAGFPRLFLALFRYGQPILISRMIAFVTGYRTGTTSASNGVEFIILALFVYSGMAISTAVYKRQIDRAEVMSRGALVGLIYSRALTIRDGVCDDAQALSLMSNEVDAVGRLPDLFHEGWAQILEVVIGMYMLAREIGWVSVTPLIMVVFCSRVSHYTASNIGPNVKLWNIAKQKRIAMISSMLDSVKSLKMLSMMEVLESRIKALRMEELDAYKHYRWVTVAYNASANALGIFCPIVTLIIFAVQAQYRKSDAMDTETAFTALAIMSMVIWPANMLMTIYPSACQVLASLERIQDYLLEPSREDKRLEVSRSSVHANGNDHARLDMRRPNGYESYAILIEHLTIRPSPKSDPVLIEFNAKVKQGSFFVCSGAVGTGKTTLARAMLGDIAPDNGTISVASKRIGYCAQTPWLPNATIKNIICDPVEEDDIDEQWYKKVTDACGLYKDLTAFPGGDQYVGGNRGFKLSGGQRQRVALARTVFARSDIVVLDDVLSALDNTTADHVVASLFGCGGLFRELGTTVFLITHATNALQLADYIIKLEKDPRTVVQGTWDELRSKTLLLDGVVYNRTDASDDVTSETNDTKLRAWFETTNAADEDLTRKTGDFAIYGIRRYYFKSIGLVNLSLLISCIAFYAFFLHFPFYWLKWWTEARGQHMWFYICGYLLMSTIAYIATNAGFITTLVRSVPRSGAILHHRLLRTITRAPLSYFSETNAGVILNRFTSDISLVDGQLALAFMQLTVQIFRMLFASLLLFIAQPIVLSTLPFCTVIVYFIQKLYLHTSRQLRFMDLESRSAVVSSFLETVEGISTIRAFGWQSASIRRNIQHLDHSQQPHYLMLSLQRWLNLVLDLIIGSIAVIVIGLAVMLRGTTSGGAIGVALVVILNTNQVLLRLVQSYTNLEVSLGAVARIRDVERTVPSEEAEEEYPPSSLSNIPPTWPTQEKITFQDVTVSYNATSPPVLKNLTLTIPAHSTTVIRGRTGSGKSTLLLSLLRLTPDPAYGKILIDDVNIRNIPRQILRSRLITVPQDTLVIGDSVRANICADLNQHNLSVSDIALKRALERVGLWDVLRRRIIGTEKDDRSVAAAAAATTSTSDINQDVRATYAPPTTEDQEEPEEPEELPQIHNVLSLPLSPSSLSHGQRQLLSLARAIIRKNTQLLPLPLPTSSPSFPSTPSSSDPTTTSTPTKGILLLDEATSHLDVETDRFVQKVVREEFRGWTVVSVAHRAVMMDDGLGNGDGDGDLVVEMEGGRIKVKE